MNKVTECKFPITIHEQTECDLRALTNVGQSEQPLSLEQWRDSQQLSSRACCHDCGISSGTTIYTMGGIYHLDVEDCIKNMILKGGARSILEVPADKNSSAEHRYKFEAKQ